jgi:hypothetical protein
MDRSIIGQTLRRVSYFNLPNADWPRTTDMHRLDFGLDLEFDRQVVGITWSVGPQLLSITDRSLRSELPDADELDASAIEPWHQVVGHVATAVIDRVDEPTVATLGTREPWSIRLEFERAITIWIAAVTILESEGIVIKGGDEVVVVWKSEVATRIGMQ